ncbi:MAG: iron-containing alcohol dehydrogenase [Lachnospiraceae bacterium]|nr:iron-containing alcohol dehydrogenase [Lachnospiraceae bacterium]
MEFEFKTSGKAWFGDHALEKAIPSICALGQKALIVTGGHTLKTGAMDRLTENLQTGGLTWEIFHEIGGEPTEEMIQKGAALYRDSSCDMIIGLGGGSPLDSAKAIAVYATDGTAFCRYGGQIPDRTYPPTVLIPTTAGTGSEATRFFCVTDTSTNEKLLLSGEALLPRIAIIDPTFTMTAPPAVTAATGMDALTHAIEAYTSRRSNPLTDLYATDAIKRIFQYLPIAYQNGSDRIAREELAIAAYEAGICISNASVTLVHGMSRPIGALFHVPHGMSNAMLITECLQFASSGCIDRFGALGRLIHAASPEENDQHATEAFLCSLQRLCQTLEIPTLREYGIDEDEFIANSSKMATDALASLSPANTIRPVSRENILEIYRKLWKR